MIRSIRLTADERHWLRGLSTLNEDHARFYVADRSMDQGRGGITRLSKLTGMSRTTITKAVAESCAETFNPMCKKHRGWDVPAASRQPALYARVLRLLVRMRVGMRRESTGMKDW